MNNRDFKGVWIPKEIWLSTELTMIEKVILTEINSLDNENHCNAGNDYFSEFCNCSSVTVSKAINHLIELNLVEKVSFDGRSRVLKIKRQPLKNLKADIKKFNANNINNNTINNNFLNNSNELLQKIEKSKTEKPKRKNLYESCDELIDAFTTDIELNNLLKTYLSMRLEIKDKPLYKNTWKGLLNKLSKLSSDIGTQCEIVQRSIDRGYASFYEIPKYNKNNATQKPWNKNVKSVAYTDDELEELEEKEKEMNANGIKTRF